MEYELVPSENHRRNQAERVIQTFKAHFILILAGVDDKFPLSLWCHLLQPTELTLNLLCQSKVTPKILAFAHIHGSHNYMKKLFAPLGCAIQANCKPDDPRTWDTRANVGFNLGTSIEHHCCYHVYITKTRSTRISNTVAFQHQYITNPAVSPESHVIAAAQQLATALKGNLPMKNETAEALTTVSILFAKIAAAKLDAAAAKEECNKLRPYPAARITLESPPPSENTPLPRVGTAPTAPISRVAASTQVNCCITLDIVA
jgi:hypothetical protein